LGAADPGQEFSWEVRSWIAGVNPSFWRSLQRDLQAVSSRSNLAAIARVRLQGGRKAEVKTSQIPFWVLAKDSKVKRI